MAKIRHRWRCPIGSTFCNGKYMVIKTADGWKSLSRVVAAEALGRELLPTEHVHHKDGDTLNNDRSNLEVLDGRTHNSQHSQGHPATRRKLSDQHIIEIREKVALHTMSMRKIGMLYSVSPATVCEIASGKRWKNVGIITE